MGLGRPQLAAHAVDASSVMTSARLCAAECQRYDVTSRAVAAALLYMVAHKTGSRLFSAIAVPNLNLSEKVFSSSSWRGDATVVGRRSSRNPVVAGSILDRIAAA